MTPDLFGLGGRVAVVTGAGIGRAIALGLARHGAAMLAWIVPPGEAAPVAAGHDAAADGDAAATGRGTVAATGRTDPSPPGAGPPVPLGDAPPRISPRARRAAASLGVDWTLLVGSGGTGRIVERDVRAAAGPPAMAPPPPAPRASPVVRRLAEVRGVDLGQVAPGGPAGRVTLATSGPRRRRSHNPKGRASRRSGARSVA